MSLEQAWGHYLIIPSVSTILVYFRSAIELRCKSLVEASPTLLAQNMLFQGAPYWVVLDNL